MKICPQCNIEYQDNMNFCPECGSKLENKPNVCPECGTEYENGQKFCAECGTKLYIENTTTTDCSSSYSYQRLHESSTSICTKEKPSKKIILHVICDLECRILQFGKEIEVEKMNEDSFIQLLPGRHLFTIEHADYKDLNTSFEYTTCSYAEDYVEISLKNVLKQKTQELLKTGCVVVKKGEKVSIISLDGKIQLPAPFPFNYQNIDDNIVILRKYDNGTYESNREEDEDEYKIPTDSEIQRMHNAGAIDFEGNVIVPFQYYSIGTFHDGLAYIMIQHKNVRKQGFINKKGKIVVPVECEFGNYKWADDYENGVVSVNRNGKCTCLRIDGTEISPFSLHQWPNSYKYFELYDGDRRGIVDINGKIIIKGLYNWCIPYEKYNLIEVYDGKRCSCFDLQGNQITGYYEHIEILSANLFIVNIEGKYGVINRNCKIVIPLEYDEVKMYDMVAPSGFILEENAFRVKKGHLYGYIDIKGNVIHDCIFSKATFFNEGLACVETNRWPSKDLGFVFFKGLISVSGEEVFCIRGLYQGFEYRKYSETYCVRKHIVGGDDKYGLLDCEGNELCEFIYSYATFLTDEIIRVRIGDYYLSNNDKYGLLDIGGNIVVPSDYQEIKHIGSDVFLLKKSYKKYNCCNAEGNILLDSFYELILKFENILFACNGKQMVLYSLQGKKISEYVYDKPYAWYSANLNLESPFVHGLMKISRNNQYGYINTYGKETIPCIYDSARDAVRLTDNE